MSGLFLVEEERARGRYGGNIGEHKVVKAGQKHVKKNLQYSESQPMLICANFGGNFQTQFSDTNYERFRPN